MSKSKPKSAKKKSSRDFFQEATAGLKKFRRLAKQVKKLSTAQKVVGGLTLLAAGYAIVATQSKGNDSGAAEPAPAKPEELPPTESQPAPLKAEVLASKRKKAASMRQPPFSEEQP